MPQQRPDRPCEELVLQYPIKGEDGEIDRIYVMRPKGKEMGLLPSNAPNLASVHPWLAKLCGLTVTQLEMLDGQDYMAAQKLVEEFVGEFPKGGPGSASSSGDTRTGG